MSNRYDNHENSSGCSYVNLSHYNNGSRGTHPHVPKGHVSGSYLVPTYDSIGYDSLTHKEYNNSCCGSPYPNIRAAYKTHDGNCKQNYTSMECNK